MQSILRKKFCIFAVLVLVLVCAAPAFSDKSISRSEFNRIVRLAKKGDPKAQTTLGYIYCGDIYYDRLKKDYKRGFYWIQQAAEQDFAEACGKLGYMYKYGQGVTKDYQEAMKWFLKAAEHNLASAQNSIGVLYLDGCGVETNYQEALKWFHKSAEQNYHYALYNIGFCYENGRGVEKNYNEALAWYQRAAENGNEKASKIIDAYVMEHIAPKIFQEMMTGGGNTQYNSPEINEAQQWRKCSVCDGTGQCPDCHGTGKSNELVKMYGLFDSYYDYLECNRCRGNIGKCYECGGTGKVAATLW